jgi:signal transduction histidine kinase
MSEHSEMPKARASSNFGIALYLALLLAFGAGFSWTSWQAERAREMKSLSALIELGEKSLDTFFSQIESALHVLGDDLRGSGKELDLVRADIAVKRFKKAFPDLQIVIVTRTDGQIVASSEVARGTRLPTLANEPSFVLGRDELLNGATLSIGRPFLGLISKQWIIPLRYGVRDDKGHLLFLIGLGLPLAKPQSFWKNAPLPQGAGLGLTRDDGFLVARYPVPDQVELANVYGKAISGSLINFLQQQGFPPGGIFVGRSALTGSETIFVYRRLSHYPLTVYVANPITNFWAAWWQQVRFSFLLMAILSVGGIVAYRWNTRRQQTWEREREQHISELRSANTELGDNINMLKRMQRELVHTEKLAALGSLVAGVAHEINTPVGIGYTAISYLDEQVKTLSARYESGAMTRSDLSKFIASATESTALGLSNMRRAAELIRSFKLVAVDQASSKRRDFILKEMVEEVIATLRHLVKGAGVRIELELTQGIRMQSYPGPLGQAITNLLNNALLHAFEGRESGCIRIEARLNTPDEVLLRFSDDGVGIPAQNMGRIFDPFFTTKLGQGGSGLGLNIVHNIVTGMLGGRISVESQPGAGTLFSIYLPCIAPEADGEVAG